MSQIFTETVELIAKLQADYEAQMKAMGKPIPVYNDADEGAPTITYREPVASATAPAKAPAAPRKEGTLKATSKAEQAREIMRATKDSGKPLEDIIQMIMDATGHDKALAKATYKANAVRVGIVL